MQPIAVAILYLGHTFENQGNYISENYIKWSIKDFAWQVPLYKLYKKKKSDDQTSLKKKKKKIKEISLDLSSFRVTV